MSSKPIGLILAGGRSLRLFPLDKPKPLLEVSGRFLLSEAIQRLKGFDTYVIANRGIALEISKAFRERGLKVPQFLLEPVGRDTAAAVGFGLRKAIQKKAPWVAILSADHWMPESKKFPQFLKGVGREVAEHPESLFVAGSPAVSKEKDSHSQFGWILSAKKIAGGSQPVQQFVEKPVGAKLRQLISRGALINAGMFFGTTAAWQSAYLQYFPEALDRKIPFKNLKRLPVDRAIFENFQSVRVVRQPLRWEDLGTWEDWARLKLASSKTKCRVYSSAGMQNVFTRATKLKEIYTFGLSNIAVVEENGKLLVMPLSETRKMKTYLEAQSA